MTDRVIIDIEQAVALLRVEVFEKGADYRYHNPAWCSDDVLATCQNFHGNEPGCIVGHVVHRLGLKARKAEKLKIAGASGATDTCRELNADPKFGFTFTENAINVLFVAQSAQDDRYTWGVALAKAEEEAALMRSE